MVTDDQVVKLFAAANPVPSLDLLTAERATPEDATAHHEGRPTMSIIETRKEQSTLARRPRIAAIAAAVLLGIIVLPMLLTENSADNSAAASQEVAMSFTSALEDLDGETAEALVTDEAEAIYLSRFGYGQDQPGTLVGLWEWAAIYDTTYTFEACRASNRAGDAPPADPPAGSGNFLTCDYLLENEWTRAVGQPAMTGRFLMEIIDDKIVWLTDDHPLDEFEPTWSMVADWVRTQHPNDFGTMFLDRATSARLTPESLDLWRQHNPAITASLSG